MLYQDLYDLLIYVIIKRIMQINIIIVGQLLERIVIILKNHICNLQKLDIV